MQLSVRFRRWVVVAICCCVVSVVLNRSFIVGSWLANYSNYFMVAWLLQACNQVRWSGVDNSVSVDWFFSI